MGGGILQRKFLSHFHFLIQRKGRECGWGGDEEFKNHSLQERCSHCWLHSLTEQTVMLLNLTLIGKAHSHLMLLAPLSIGSQPWLHIKFLWVLFKNTDVWALTLGVWLNWFEVTSGHQYIFLNMNRFQLEKSLFDALFWVQVAYFIIKKSFF